MHMTACRTRQEAIHTELLQRCGSDAAYALRAHFCRGIKCYYASARRDTIATRLDLALRSASASASAILAVNAAALPAVIIARILSFLRLEQRIIVSHTCSTWRAAALAAEDLWRNVVIGDYPSVTGVLSLDGMPSLSQPRPNWAAALEILRRRRSLPASAAVVCNVSQFDAEIAIQSMVSGLRAVVGQVATLYLKAFAERNLTTSYDGTPHIIEHVVCYPAPSTWLAFADSLCCSAPFLESLAVRAPRVMHSDDEPTLYLDPDTLCGEPQVLRTCWLDQVALPPMGCHAFSKLTTFEYDPRNRKITDTEVHDILVGMPCLETLGLTLEAESFFTDQPPLTLSPSRSIMHRHLRHLGLMIYADAFSTYAEVPRLLHFFSSRAEPGLVTVADLREPDAWGVSDSESGSNITSDMDDPDSVHLTTYAMMLRKGSTTLLHSPQYEMPLSDILRPNLDGYNLHNMVQLVISEDLWPEDGAAIPPLPNLRNLCVILLSCTFMLTGPYQIQPRNVLGIFVFLPSLPPLRCPSLTDVRISAPQSWNSEPPSIPCIGEEFTVDGIRDASFRCACRNGCILSLADTADFITHRLRFTAPRLTRLTLSGMRDFAEPDGPARSRAFDLLRQICAEEIIVEPDVPARILDMQAIAEYRDIDSSPVRLLDPRGSVLLGRDPFTLGEQADFYIA